MGCLIFKVNIYKFYKEKQINKYWTPVNDTYVGGNVLMLQFTLKYTKNEMDRLQDRGMGTG